MRRVIMAAIPRSGSTWFCRSLAGKPQGDMWGGADPHIAKTHFPAPPTALPDGWCAVFMFGDPVASVASTMKNRNEEAHYRNCACVMPRGSMNLQDGDWLGYERMFDSWTTFPGTLCLRYETATRHVREVRAHTGWEFDFLPLRRRTGRAWLPDVSRVEATYGSLCSKVEASPDCWVVGAGKETF